MIVGIGIDICENSRIKSILEKFPDRFLKRVFNDNEIGYCSLKSDPVPYYAARFALKEAFIKALGLKRDLAISYKEVYLSGGVGKKKLNLEGKLDELFKERANSAHFSISHSQEYSSAVVVLEKNG